MKNSVKADELFLHSTYGCMYQREAEVRAMWKGRGEHEDRRKERGREEEFFFFPEERERGGMWEKIGVGEGWWWSRRGGGGGGRFWWLRRKT